MNRTYLALLIGRYKNDDFELHGELSFTPSGIDLENAKQEALANHPALKNANANINKKSISKKLSWIGLLPNLEFRYFQVESNEKIPQKFKGGEIGLSVPLWFFLKDQSKIRTAGYNYKAAKYNFQIEKNKVLFQVKSAYTKLFVAEKQVQNFKENTLQEVEELVRIASISYEEGEMGYLEVTEALRTLNRTKAGYYESIFEYVCAQAELEKAIGKFVLIK